jgi:hypothetical protein
LIERDRLPLRAESIFAGMVRADGEAEEVGPIGFASAAAVRAFVCEMQPHTVSFNGVNGADIDALEAALALDAVENGVH